MFNKNPFHRSKKRIIAGVCGGIAERYGWKPYRFRIAFVLISCVSAAFPGFLVYLLLWFIMPNHE